MFANFMDEIDENRKIINDPSKVRQMEKIEKCVESFKKDLGSGSCNRRERIYFLIHLEPIPKIDRHIT